MAEVSFLAVFLVGLLGGAHCAVMCGPVVSTLHTLSRAGAPNVNSPGKLIPIVSSANHGHAAPTMAPAMASRPIVTGLAYNLGRISTYTMLGSLAGSLGAGAWLIERWVPVQQLALLLTSVSLVILGLYLLRVRRVVAFLEGAGGYLWRLVQPFAQQRLLGAGITNAYLAGVMWGLLPCGMVYGAVAIALASGSGLNGALLMMVFGLGTLPNLLLIGAIGDRAGTAILRRSASRVAGFIVIGFGIFGIVRLLMTTSMLAPLMQ